MTLEAMTFDQADKIEPLRVEELTLDGIMWSSVWEHLSKQGYTSEECDSMVESASVSCTVSDRTVTVRVPPKLDEVVTINVVAP